jgi:high affinity sulfate transporter 1
MTTALQQQRHVLPFYERVLPILQWLPSYNVKNLPSDVLAGLSAGSFAVPENMAYASLAGMPPQTGLYTGMVAQLAYVFFGTSQQLGIGPTSALSIMVAGALAGVAAGDSNRYVALASLMAILVGLISLLGYVFRLGMIPKFISKSVLTGFSLGALLYIAASQLPKLFGIHGGEGNVFHKYAYLLMHLGQTNVPSLAIGCVGLVILLLGHKLSRQIPWPLVVMVGSIVVMSMSNLQSAGVNVAGNIPRGLPQLTIPDVTWDDVLQILPLSFSVFLLSYVEGVSFAKVFADKNDYRIDANQELVAVGAANVSAGLFAGFAVGGSMSKTAVSDGAGAKTPLYGLFVSLVLAMVAMFLTGFFYNLPEPILASIVLVAIMGLFELPEWRNIYNFSRREFALAMITFLGVLFTDMLHGILIGVFVSLIAVLWVASNPHSAVLGRMPDSDLFADIERQPEAEQIPGVLVYRVDASIFFANEDDVKQQILELVEKQSPSCRLVVIDFDTTPSLDYAGGKMLIDLRMRLARKNVACRLARTNARVRDVLRKLGVAEEFGVTETSVTVAGAIEAWQSETRTA